MDRKTFLGQAGALAMASLLPRGLFSKTSKRGVAKAEDLFTISLSQWSYHRAIFGDAREDYNWFIKTLHSDPDAVLKGDLDPRDVVKKARQFDVDVVDLVNILWFGHGQDGPWLEEFKRRAAGEGVRFGVLMCDQLGHIGSSSVADRMRSVENHIRWMDTAAELGCQHFRVNAYGDGTYLQQLNQCAESLRALAEAAEQYDFDVLVENHGHPGSNGAWLAMLIEKADHPKVGAFADFDNFFMGGWGLNPERRYDTHQGMLDLAPYTRAVSAKSFDFDSDGNETRIDFPLCLQTAMDGGFKGLASAEYEGEHLSEEEGTRLTIQHLRQVRKELF
ncbi:sugar phosphate isomerase/epimerase family protein [Pelagicoccus mobilis]|uniref:Sugar phosphate isomerase/epimerase n=1 Tax=Pelagicoccus mobilis TaxID=415221 RepID=A0A934S1F3_9BACT|nr:sugar phosphate isomerase/epimerase family protein [Pelagicoccus mobilis]MBK1880601.1 sugar phosphate isomerase/epimerase [Pelagicoccus mobilis]